MFFPMLFVFICHRAVQLASANCQTPAPGQCRTNNSDHSQDREVFSPSSLNCQFNNDLCSYRQGCFDTGVTNWTAEDGYAVANYSLPPSPCGASEYSILESRWVNFTMPSCIQFTFARFVPLALEVFLAHIDGTATTTILERNNNNQSNGGNQTVRYVVSGGTGKFQFRLFGGGGGGTPIRLYYVTIRNEDCATPVTTSPSQPPVSLSTATDTVSLSSGHTESNTLPPSTVTPAVGEHLSTQGQQQSSGTVTSQGASVPGTGESSSTLVIALAVVAAVAVASVIVVVVFHLWWRNKMARHMSRTEGQQAQMDTVETNHNAGAGDLSARAADEETTNTPLPDEYDRVGEMSPANNYNSLNSSTTTPATATTANSNMETGDKVSYYYNVAEQGNKMGGANSYYNVGRMAGASGGPQPTEGDVYEEVK